ncbi:MAG: 2,3-bisphosphoglycerate-independent phosphoglycerate mutase [Candidatus Dojkabacteria bacterium]
MKVILLVIDGWGIGELDKNGKPDKFDAIANADTPNIDRLIREYPNTRLKTDGESVGLPEGQFGTSEVNHLTIGAGRVILQDLPKINKAIADGRMRENKAIIEAIEQGKQGGGLHFTGVLSDGGVHAHIDHTFALIELARELAPETPIYAHAFADGRDVSPKSAGKYLDKLQKTLDKVGNAAVATLQGRYLLDRDRDWEKTDQAYAAITKGEGIKVSNYEAALNMGYSQVNSDEYLPSFILDEKGLIKSNHGIIFTHYRTDRLYQLAHKILNSELENISLCSFVSPGENFKQLKVAFPREQVSDTLPEVIAEAGLRQMHITETEKFPHVTYFFSGENEKELPGEVWEKIESNRFVKPRYNFDPDMQNFPIAQRIIEATEGDKFDFILANFSSPDMVGHTGNYEAAVVSAEAVDYCVGKIYEALKPKLNEYALIVTADHGNSEQMWDYEANQPHTQHTTNKVPFILASGIDSAKLARRESLEDIAPTILELLGLEKPAIMTGESLLE